MGQEESRLIGDDVEPITLVSRDLDGVAELIRERKAKNIVVLAGAGISTSAGIPDFRTPGTGLYDNLESLNLPEPEAVFSLPFFKENPHPFYVLANELYPGRYHPTITHVFIKLLHEKGILKHVFTQNIDCLERRAGVPHDIIVEAHGSFATQRCIDCKTPYPDDLMRKAVEKKEPPRCQSTTPPARGSGDRTSADQVCGGLVKPDIVFFGEALPASFSARRHYANEADLLLIMGTSLSVYPFAGLADFADTGVPRVLFNLQRVGTLGSRADDVCVLRDCDSGVRELAEKLGWLGELEQLWKQTVGIEEARKQVERVGAIISNKTVLLKLLTHRNQGHKVTQGRDKLTAFREDNSSDDSDDFPLFRNTASSSASKSQAATERVSEDGTGEKTANKISPDQSPSALEQPAENARSQLKKDQSRTEALTKHAGVDGSEQAKAEDSGGEAVDSLEQELRGLQVQNKAAL